MKKVKLDATSVACGAVAGLGLGGLGGYLLHRHLSKTRFEARVDTEIRAVRDHYNARAKAFLETGNPFVGPASAMGNRKDDDPDDLPGDDGFSEEEEGYPAELADDEGEDEDGWPPANRDRSKPYVISVVEFANRSVGLDWQVIVVTWYEGDNILVDEQEHPIPDLRNTTGFLNLEMFERNNVAGDPTRCYIRNERIKTDFEVILDRRTYAEGVLNYGNPRMPDG